MSSCRTWVRVCTVPSTDGLCPLLWRWGHSWSPSDWAGWAQQGNVSILNTHVAPWACCGGRRWLVSVPHLLCTWAAHLHTRVLKYSSLHVHMGLLHVSVLMCTHGTCHPGSSGPMCSMVLLCESTPVHTQHTLGTALHMCVPVSILTSCLPLCGHVLQACLHPGVCWFAHTCSLAHAVAVSIPTPADAWALLPPPLPLPW